MTSLGSASRLLSSGACLNHPRQLQRVVGIHTLQREGTWTRSLTDKKLVRLPIIQMTCGMSRYVDSSGVVSHEILHRFDKLKVWKTSKEPEPFEDVEEDADAAEEREYLRSLEEKERETRAEYIESRRNKSRLSASHRQIVKGEMPYVGTMFNYTSEHQSKEHKRGLMSKYGRKQAGVDPGQCWPTKEEIQLAREWEDLYQEKPLKEMIQEARQAVEDAHQAKLEREKEVVKNLEQMDRQVKQWKDRMGAKTRMLDAERERREKVLEELRLEFGYVINPEDNYMKGRIAEREKVLIKEEKEKKKQEKKEKGLQRNRSAE